MAKVPGDAQAQGKPQLKPDRMGNADLIGGTIQSVEFRKSQFRDNPQPVIVFKEYGDMELRVGKRGTSRLVEQFGEETDDWIGEYIPLVKAREEVGAKSYVVYQVPPVEEWPGLLKQLKKVRK